MMKKLLVLMLVLGIASAASAALTWSTSAVSVTQTGSVTVQLVGDTIAGSYSVDATAIPVANISVVALAGAGDESSVYQYPQGHASFAGFVWLQVLDTAEPFNAVIGDQFDVTLSGTGLAAGTYMIDGDYYGANPMLAFTVIPEPMTLGLLGLGGLFLRRRK